MSLNGLDEPTVIEAHEVAAAEPGGWFLLKYVSRDGVELLHRGTGGLVEIRDVVAAYDEESPLYGFLRYRRRNVLIKYLPENCSRLIRARVAVHFNAVCERFSPHDTVFEISTAAELRDTKLSAACSLHAASGSTSSSTSSVKRRQLVEIAEEDEEDQRALKRQSLAQSADVDRPKTPPDRTISPDPVLLNSDLAFSPEAIRYTSTSTSEVPNFGGGRDGPTSPARSIDPDSLSFSSHHTSKQRVKLGPRPLQAESTVRPQTAGNFKPVSSIPVGLKLFGKGAKKGKGRDKDGGEKEKEKERARDGILPTVTTLAPADSFALDRSHHPIRDDANGFCRPNSSTSLASLAPAPAPVPAKPIITPEKARLMKAMQLREKKKKTMAAAKMEEQADAKSVHDETTTTDTTETHVQQGTVGETDEDHHDVIHEEKVDGNMPGEGQDEKERDEENGEGEEDEEEVVVVEEVEEEGDSDKPSTGAEDGIEVGEQEAGTPAAIEKEKRIPLTPTDSGVVLDSPVQSAHLDETSETPHMELRADSPTLLSSEADHSTVASSLSELTDQTAQAKSTELCEDDHVQEDRIKDDKKEVEPEMQESQGSAPQGTENVPSTHEPGHDSVATHSPKEGANQAEDVDEKELLDGEESPRLMVPKSKFSTQDPVSVSKAGSPSSSVIVSPQSEPENSQIEGREEAAAPAVTEAEEPEAETSMVTTEADVGSTSLTADCSDLVNDNSSLQDAMMLPDSRSPSILSEPLSVPVLPSRAPGLDNVRTVSNPNPLRGALAPPSEPQNLMRSTSSGAAFLNRVNRQQQSSSSSTVIVKPIVGSSISERIKALEKLSANSPDSSRPASRDRPSSSFYAVPKRETSGSPSVAERTNSLKHPPPSATAHGSATTRNRSPSITSRLSRFDSLRGRHESNRNARLDDSKDVLDSKDDYDGESVVSERTSISLEREVRNAKRSSISVSMAKDFIKEHRKSATISSDMQQILNSAITSSRPSSAAQPTINNNTVSSRLSISSRRSSINKDRDHAVLMSAIADDEKGGKSMSRTERFMRRLSNFPGARGKGSVSLSSPVTEGGSDAAGSRQPAEGLKGARTASAGGEASAGVAADMGDVNVQFPDNLLWKRRNMCLDTHGFLILSASVQTGKAPAVGTKRYHLSEFRQPYAPDVEVQELPNSVVLDFIEGSGIQVACEDRSGQRNVLKVLREAHAGHSTFGK